MKNPSYEWLRNCEGVKSALEGYLDETYWIEDNSGAGDLFLMKGFDRGRDELLTTESGYPFILHQYTPSCVGGVSRRNLGEYWEASISKPDSDCEVIFQGSREEAIQALWDARHKAGG